MVHPTSTYMAVMTPEKFWNSLLMKFVTTPPLVELGEYINMASIIKATGVPNYKCARFPVQSDLIIDV